MKVKTTSKGNVKVTFTPADLRLLVRAWGRSEVSFRGEYTLWSDLKDAAVKTLGEYYLDADIPEFGTSVDE